MLELNCAFWSYLTPSGSASIMADKFMYLLRDWLGTVGCCDDI